jgi:protease I
LPDERLRFPRRPRILSFKPAPALKGRKVTCFHSIKDDVQNAGGVYVDQEVCIDGNVITSRTPEDLPAFVVALIEMMRKG